MLLNRVQKVVLFVFGILVFSELSYSNPIDKNGDMCQRNISWDYLMSNQSILSSAQKSALAKGDQVTVFIKQKTGFEVGYLFQYASGVEPEIVMGIFSRSDRHKGAKGLGDFILDAKIIPIPPSTAVDVENPPNPYRTSYTQDVTLYEDSTYIQDNYFAKLTLENGKIGYELNSVLVDSNMADFAPRWADAYMKAVQHNGGAFVAACNYMVARDAGWMQGMFNSYASDRLKSTGASLLSWVKRVQANPTEAAEYRERTKRLVAAGIKRIDDYEIEALDLSNIELELSKSVEESKEEPKAE